MVWAEDSSIIKEVVLMFVDVFMVAPHTERAEIYPARQV